MLAILFVIFVWVDPTHVVICRMNGCVFNCLNCSEELEETYQYCSRCGATVDIEEVLIRHYFQLFTLFRKVPCNRNVCAYFAQ